MYRAEGYAVLIGLYSTGEASNKSQEKRDDVELKELPKAEMKEVEEDENSVWSTAEDNIFKLLDRLGQSKQGAMPKEKVCPCVSSSASCSPPFLGGIACLLT